VLPDARRPERAAGYLRQLLRHCTGEPFYEILKAELPKKVIRSYTGTKLVFGA
jgi:hypothetical protein